jgi:SAM-dependent methyltransferase
VAVPDATAIANRADLCAQHVWTDAAVGRLAHCERCGLVATSCAPRFEYQARYFTDDAVGGYDFDADFALDFDAARFSAELDRLERQGLHGSVLDIGCATGSFLSAAAARGWTVSGVEVVDFARREATRRTGALVAGSCSELPAGQVFDVVTLHHVLEHLHDPVVFLQTIVAPRVRRRLLIEVPNFASLPSRVHGSHWLDLRLEQHVYHYVRDTLVAVVSSAGFRVDHAYTLWEPLWSVRATIDLARLLVHGALGRDRRWECANGPNGNGTHAVPATTVRYRRPAGVRLAATKAIGLACRPLTAALEAAGLGSRLVVEASPTPSARSGAVL